MEKRDFFDSISPLDNRYWNANKELFRQLSTFISEKGFFRYIIKAEVALLQVHINEHPESRQDWLVALENLESEISPEEIIREEHNTQHQMRAVIRVIQRRLPPHMASWVHLGATSADILDSAAAMRLKDVTSSVLVPLLLDLLDALIDKVRQEHDTVQIGRTHGQHAVPITFGFAMAEYVSRLGQSVPRIFELANKLCGKLSGAVGAYNATSLISPDPVKLEESYLQKLEICKADYSSQIVEPEHTLRLLLEMNVAFGIMANLADDLRNLQRTEIAEISEFFGTDQVGSSTMPQKRNPWNSEHVKSLWKTFAPRVLSFFMDQISEHQRDLTNSASSRFQTEYIAGFAIAISRMLRIIKSLEVHRNKMKENIDNSLSAILAEPAYILFSLAGVHNAHEVIRQISMKSYTENVKFENILKKEHPEIWKSINAELKEKTGLRAEEFYNNPASYIGLADRKAVGIADKYSCISKEVREKLNAHDGKNGYK